MAGTDRPRPEHGARVGGGARQRDVRRGDGPRRGSGLVHRAHRYPQQGPARAAQLRLRPLVAPVAGGAADGDPVLVPGAPDDLDRRGAGQQRRRGGRSARARVGRCDIGVVPTADRTPDRHGLHVALPPARLRAAASLSGAGARNSVLHRHAPRATAALRASLVTPSSTRSEVLGRESAYLTAMPPRFRLLPYSRTKFPQYGIGALRWRDRARLHRSRAGALNASYDRCPCGS